jgi:transcriptional regulator with XRE-family HTH domain
MSTPMLLFIPLPLLPAVRCFRFRSCRQFRFRYFRSEKPMDLQEQSRAERAMNVRAGTNADHPGPEKQQWPSVARRIREARLRTGLTDTEVAQRLNMTIHSYWDLEHHDDEAFTVASLANLTALGQILGVAPRFLLLGSGATEVNQTITFSDIAARLAERIATDVETVEQFGDSIGWDVSALLTDPQALWSYDVEGLYNIAKALGLDWVAALPRISAIR